MTNGDKAIDVPELGRIAVAHLGVGLVLVSLFTWIEPVANPRDTGLAGIPMLVVSILVVIAALRASDSSRNVVRALYGALAFGSGAFLAGAIGIWTNAAGADPQITVVLAGAVGGFLVALLHFRKPSIGTVLALGLATIAVAVGLVGERSGADRAAAAAVLFVVSVTFAMGALLDWLRPSVTAGFISVVTGLGAAAIVVAEHVDNGPRLLALVMMLIVNIAVLALAIPSTVVAVAIGDSLVIAAVANQWDASNWYAVGPAAGGLIAFVIAVRAERTSSTNLRLGGAYALCALLALAGGQNIASSQPVLQDLLGVVVLLGLAIAAASAGRVLITALAILDLVGVAPSRFLLSSSSDRHVEEALVIVAGLAILAVAARGSATHEA